jgi:hypothetical protein
VGPEAGPGADMRSWQAGRSCHLDLGLDLDQDQVQVPRTTGQARRLDSNLRETARAMVPARTDSAAGTSPANEWDQERGEGGTPTAGGSSARTAGVWRWARGLVRKLVHLAGQRHDRSSMPEGQETDLDLGLEHGRGRSRAEGSGGTDRMSCKDTSCCCMPLLAVGNGQNGESGATDSYER